MQENTTKELKTPMTTKQKVWFGVKNRFKRYILFINFIGTFIFPFQILELKTKMIKFLIFLEKVI